MKNWLIQFKIIDHYSDSAAPLETTTIEAATKREALDDFYLSCMGETVFIESIEEMK